MQKHNHQAAFKIIAAQKLYNEITAETLSTDLVTIMPDLALLSNIQLLRPRLAEGGGTLPDEKVVESRWILDILEVIKEKASSLMAQGSVPKEPRIWLSVLSM